MRKRRQPSFAAAPFAPSPDPISDLNTTPLIDVMLVLLIMFIITIPMTTHKVPLDLPSPGPTAQEPIVHSLELDSAGAISLDGAHVALAQLPARLAAIRAEPTGEIHLRADAETPYDSFDTVMATLKRSGIDRLGMIGNDRFVSALDH